MVGKTFALAQQCVCVQIMKWIRFFLLAYFSCLCIFKKYTQCCGYHCIHQKSALLFALICSKKQFFIDQAHSCFVWKAQCCHLRLGFRRSICKLELEMGEEPIKLKLLLLEQQSVQNNRMRELPVICEICWFLHTPFLPPSSYSACP